MRLRRYGRKKKKARIEIIPMIDTMFFLLVFFMVATMSMTVTRGLPVSLPASDSAKKEDMKERRSITVTRDGQLFIDKEPAGRDALLNTLKKEAASNPDMLVIINADSDVSHGRVVEVIDTVKLAGVTRLAIATKPKE